MILGETPREARNRQDTRDDLNRLMWSLGNREYIDEFTTTQDLRSPKERALQEFNAAADSFEAFVNSLPKKQEKKNE